MAAVVLESLSKVYAGGVRAVDAIDLVVESGEFVVLVGPSGCGKSTTLRMVAGLEEISSGRLSIGGRVVNELPARERDIAMVFQSYALYPHLSVARNLAFGLERRRAHASGWRRWTSAAYRLAARAEDADIAAREHAAATTLGIVPLLERKPGALSGGQRQRVAVGRALVREPLVFLFDEPLSNLDAKLRVEMRAEIKELHKQTGATMLYVTHDQEEAMTLGDRLVVMRDGLVQQCATPSEVYAHPANAFVAGFVGTPAMNFLPGRLEQCDGRTHFRCVAGSLLLPAALVPRGPLAQVAEAEVVLGLRPDRIRLAGESDQATLPATLWLTENLGDRIDLRLRLDDGTQLVARRAADELGSLQEGPLRIALELEHAHLFEPDAAGARISTGV